MTNGQILRVIAGKYKGRVLHTPGGGVRVSKIGLNVAGLARDNL